MQLPGDEHEGWDALLAAVLRGGADDDVEATEPATEPVTAAAETEPDAAAPVEDDAESETTVRAAPADEESDGDGPHLVLDLNSFDATRDATDRSAARN